MLVRGKVAWCKNQANWVVPQEQWLLSLKGQGLFCYHPEVASKAMFSKGVAENDVAMATLAVHHEKRLFHIRLLIEKGRVIL